MNKKGMTLIESVVTIAILGVIFLLVTPLIRTFGRVDNRVKTQKEIDSKFSIVNEFIQEKIRAAKSSSSSTSYARIYSIEVDIDGEIVPGFSKGVPDFISTNTANEITDGTTGNILFLEIPNSEGDSNENFFYINSEKVDDSIVKSLGYQKGTSYETLINNIEDASFKFDNGIVVYYINLDIGDNEDKLKDSLRGSASTSIDFE